MKQANGITRRVTQNTLHITFTVFLCCLTAACDPRAQAATIDAAVPVHAAPTHVATMAEIGAEHGHRDVGAYDYAIATSYADAAPWVTWASTDDRYARAIHALGMKTTFYVDPHRLSPSGYPARQSLPTDESAYYHGCNGARVRTSYNGSLTQFVGNPASPALLNDFNAYISDRLRATDNAYDAVWEDDAGPLSEFYQPFDEPLPGCWYPGDERYDAAQRAFDEHARLPVIFENLTNFHGDQVSKAVALIATPNVVAGLLEYCFAADHPGREKENGTAWHIEENTALEVAREHRQFICLNYPSSADTAAALDQRGYIAASLLLTYDPASSVLAEFNTTPSGVSVEPEATIVPSSPLRAAPTSIDDLRTATGTYAREYAMCSVRGTPVGPCAIVVNPNPILPLPFPYRGYTRTLTLHGRGVIPPLDNGSVTVGGAPPIMLPPKGWSIALR